MTPHTPVDETHFMPFVELGRSIFSFFVDGVENSAWPHRKRKSGV